MVGYAPLGLQTRNFMLSLKGMVSLIDLAIVQEAELSSGIEGDALCDADKVFS